MSEQLPPVEPQLRRQLSRRSAGPLPSNLLANTMTWLDATSRPRRWRFAVPRTVAALGSVAVVALVVAALVIVPKLPTTPSSPLAGYPAERALTVDELQRAIADPSLKLNTALVAEVTVDMGTPCPGSDYGRAVIAGTSICVDDQRAVDYIAGPISATWAFRYMAPGRLLIIGEIRPASSARLSYGVADQWPVGGDTFLVSGYLGALESRTASCAASQIIDDPVEPAGDDCPFTNWLGDERTAPLIEDKVATGWQYEEDQLSLRGTARYVEAGGVRRIDAISHDGPVYGVYMVRWITEGCSALPAVDSRGCNAWRVMARVADLSLPNQTTPTPAVTPAGSHDLTDYPADRPLTAAEVADLMSGPALATNTTFVATLTIDVNRDVCPLNRAPTIGLIEGMPSQVCALDQGANLWQLKAMKLSGTYVMQYWGPGYLGVLADVTPASSSRLAFRAGETWPASGRYLVEGQLHRANVVGNDPAACPAQTPDSSGSVACSQYWLGGDSDVSQWRFDVAIAATYQNPATGLGVFLVSDEPCVVDTTPNCRALTVHARLADDPFAAVAGPTPTQAPTSTTPATPITEPPATPLVLPTTPGENAQPLGLWGDGNRPFTVAELPRIWAADPQHLAGRIVIVKGPVPAGYLCWSAGDADAGISPPPCHIGVEPSTVAAEGYWAVKVSADGTLTVLGELAVPTKASLPGGFAFTADEATSANLPPGSLAMVYASYWTDDAGKPQLRDCGNGSTCSGMVVSPVASGIIPVAGGTASGIHHWLLLVRVGSPSSILSRFEPVQP